MQELVSKAETDRVIFVEHFKDLKNVENLSKKKLCIIKTDFKNINQIKKFCKNYPALEVWLASSEVSRKNILSANSCGVKNVIPYPIDTRLIHNFFKKEDKISSNPDSFSNPYFLKGLKVLIVDDNQMNIDLLVETLSEMGLEIITFLKPIEASRAAINTKFDLCLLDIMMPEMSGFDLAGEIKNTSLNCETPIMFISALSDPENKIKGFNLGSCAYIEKPFNVNVVRSQIYNTLKTKRLQDALNDRKETFLAMVTHDLKTPVNAEICALELLLDSKSSDVEGFHGEVIRDILGAAKYMKTLVDNILHKYKCDNGNMVLKKQMFSLKTLAIECIEETKYLFEDKNQQLIFNCNVKNSDIIIDCIEIKRVVHNLLINAIEYGRRNTQITIEIYETEEDLFFSIKNLGIGISFENPNDIFEKHITYAAHDKKAGNGLGLYISKKIIDAHNGTINVESKTNEYTKMTFTLPK